MYNITFNNNHVYKIYDSEEDKTLGALTLRFSPTEYSFDAIKTFFSTKNKYIFDRIIKMTSSAEHITTYQHYTEVIGISIEKAFIPDEKEENILTLDENGLEITTSITTIDNIEVEFIVVTLKYEDPTKVIVEQLNTKINPTINVETCTLDELKRFVQKRNSDALEEFLENNPYLYIDGKYYGASKIDRDEMSQQYLAYQLQNTLNPNSTTTIKWHSRGKKCTPMTIIDFASLVLAIYAYAEPYYETMQEIKEKIYNAKSKEEILAISTFGE